MSEVEVSLIPMADLVETRTEKILPQEMPNLPFIGLDDIEAHTMRLLGTKPASDMKSSAKRFYQGDVLYSRLRPYLNKVWKADRDGMCSSEFIVIPENENVDARFIALRLNASDFVAFANSLNAGDRPRVDFGQISEFRFPCISVVQQHRIVAKIETLFSELDKGIEALKTARKQLKVYRQAVLKHAFEGKLTAHWRERNKDKLETPEQLLARIQQERHARYQQQLQDWQTAVRTWEKSGNQGKKPGKPKKIALKEVPAKEIADFPRLPVGWAYVRLGFLIEEPTYGTSKKCAYDSGEIGVLRIPNISNGSIDAQDLKFASFDEDEVRSFSLEKGDLLTIRSNGSVSLVGSCALIADKDTKFLFAGYLIRLRPHPDLVSPEFLLSVLSSHFLRRQIESVAKSTSGVNNINTGEIQNLAIPLPSVEEQVELLKFVEVSAPSIGATESEIDEQLAKSETLRQSILKKAFSGQLVPQDPNDESASALLERIQAEKRQRKQQVMQNHP